MENGLSAVAQKAKDYLLDTNNPTTLFVRFEGKKRRLFVNDRESGEPSFYMVAPKHRTWGYRFSAWNKIEDVFIPLQGEEKVNAEYKRREKIINRYKKLATTASFSNGFLRDIAKADPNKSMYENRLSTGVPIEGVTIKLSTIAKHSPTQAQEYQQALKEGKNFHSYRFSFQGYEGSLWVQKDETTGDITAGFAKEYKGCGNGYYYLAINDNCFVGYDID